MIDVGYAYAFIGGAFVGRFGGLIPAIIVSGTILYVADPSIFRGETITISKEVIIRLAKNFTG